MALSPEDEKALAKGILELKEQARANFMNMSRGYIHLSLMSIYLRFGPRFIEGSMRHCVQIARVEVEETEQHKGIFTAALAIIRRESGLPIFVESIETRRFMEGLLRRGFVVHKSYPEQGEPILWDAWWSPEMESSMKAGH